MNDKISRENKFKIRIGGGGGEWSFLCVILREGDWVVIFYFNVKCIYVVIVNHFTQS